MHIILGFLGAVLTVLFLLHRLAEAGFGLGGLNPFWWRRRRAWRQKFEANPVFSLESPKEIAALLVVGVTKIDGDMSGQEKRAVLAEFESTFSIEGHEAAELVASSAHLIGDAEVLRTQLDGILRNGRECFSAEQAESVLAMMDRIASVDGVPTEPQRRLMDSVRNGLVQAPAPQGTWG